MWGAPKCAPAVAPPLAVAESSGTVIGLCLLDVASGQCHVGSFSTAAGDSRAALATALLMHDPVECIALRNNLHGATATLVTRHCELKGCSAPGAAIGGSSGAAGKHVPGLSWLPASAAAAVLGSPMQLLAEHLPPQAAQQLQALLSGPSSGAAAAAAAGALAVCVRQLQRCSLAADVLPTLQLAGLDGMATAAAAAQGPGRLMCCCSAVCAVALHEELQCALCQQLQSASAVFDELHVHMQPDHVLHNTLRCRDMMCRYRCCYQPVAKARSCPLCTTWLACNMLPTYLMAAAHTTGSMCVTLVAQACSHAAAASILPPCTACSTNAA